MIVSLFPLVTKYIGLHNAKKQEKRTVGHKSKESLTEAILDARSMKNERGRPTTYDAIADLYGLPITRVIIWRLVNDFDYEPQRTDIRLALGLPALAPAPVCPVHGIVHVAHRCPTQRKPRQAWMSEEEVDQRLEFIRRNYDRKNLSNLHKDK